MKKTLTFQRVTREDYPVEVEFPVFLHAKFDNHHDGSHATIRDVWMKYDESMWTTTVTRTVGYGESNHGYVEWKINTEERIHDWNVAALLGPDELGINNFKQVDESVFKATLDEMLGFIASKGITAP